VTEFQANVFLSGPGSSLALRVDDPRVFNGTSFDGESLGEILSVSFASDPIASGDSVIVTVILVTPADANGAVVVIQAIDSSRCQFQNDPDHLVHFASGESSKDITMDTIDLEILETVEIRAVGSNSKSNTLTLSA